LIKHVKGEEEGWLLRGDCYRLFSELVIDGKTQLSERVDKQKFTVMQVTFDQ